jgi:transcriptional regulator with XRE-family HTH domain
MRTSSAESVYGAIGRRIREIRREKRIVQAQVADETGLTRQSVANIEHGRQRFMVHTLLDIARALDVWPHELLPSQRREGTAVNLEGLSQSARDFVLSILGPSKRT